MTVPTTVNRTVFLGAGIAGPFATNFPFILNADVKCIKTLIATGVATALVEGPDYTLVQDPVTLQGVVTLTAVLPATYKLTVYRDPAATQNTQWPPNDKFPAKTTENAIDRLTMLIQRFTDLFSRGARLADSDISGADPTLPTPVAGSLLGWSATGLALQNYISAGVFAITAFGQTLINAANAAAARAVLLSGATGDAVFLAATKIAALAALGVTSVTTKGDLWVGTAADTVARKAVGVAGYEVTADPGDATGVNYYPPPAAMSGRLTLTTALPVTVADVTAAGTVYFTPYNGNRIELYDGNGWFRYVFAEVSQLLTDATKSPAASVANTNYDVFVWNDAGVIRATRGPTWNAGAVAGSDTARGTGANSTELEQFEGRYMNKNAITNGPGARRGLYVGTIRTTAGNQAEDSVARRFVWNNFNRVDRMMNNPIETTDSWNYQSNTWRQANANAANKVEFVRGQNEDELHAILNASCVSSGANAGARVGIGIDTTTTFTAPGSPAVMDASNALGLQGVASYSGYPGLGYHYCSWNETAQITTAITFQGDGATPTQTQSGLIARMRA